MKYYIISYKDNSGFILNYLENKAILLFESKLDADIKLKELIKKYDDLMNPKVEYKKKHLFSNKMVRVVKEVVEPNFKHTTLHIREVKLIG